MSAERYRCEHGDNNRDAAGRCRTCANIRKARSRAKQVKAAPSPRRQSRTGDCPNPLPWDSFKITPSEDGGPNRKESPVVKGNDNAHAAVRNLEREMRRLMRGMR